METLILVAVCASITQYLREAWVLGKKASYIESVVTEALDEGPVNEDAYKLGITLRDLHIKLALHKLVIAFGTACITLLYLSPGR